MAVTNADILGWLNANPGADAALVNQTMAEAGVSAAQYQSATGVPPPPVQQAVAPQGMLSGPAPAPAPSNPAVTNADILGWFNANPNADVTLVNQTMQAAGVSPSQVASALTASPEIAQTYLTQQILGQGTTEKWTGQGKGSPQANAADMASILSGIGITDISQFGQITKQVPVTSTDESGNTYDTGQTQTVTTYGNKVTGQAVPNTYSERQTGNAFGGTFQGSGNTGYRVEFDAQGNPLFYTTGASSSNVPSWVKPALILGGAYLGLNAAGLLGGAPATLGVTGSTGAFLGEGVLSGIAASDAALAAATVGSTGLTMAQLAQLDLALGGAGGTLGAETLAKALTTGAAVPTLTNLTGGSGLLTGAAGGITAESVAAKLAGGAGVASVIGGAGSALPGLPAGIPPSLINAGISTAINKIIGGGGTSNIGGILNTGLTTGAGLLQQQTSREAAQRAQAMIDAETAAAKASAAFRPIGMTTRFGTSQFQVDPVTGQLTSAGYTLSPEAKAQQDRFMALSNLGLTQAEQAATQFSPLKTGAERLFGLGNEYLAQTPEQVAQNYLAQQMNLLAPSREIELANLQTKLRNQGRIGLSVAQGGNYGATTPELQALYNARARQEAELAANAQLAGQRDVMFGANLLDQGSRTMGQYYSGQTGSYAPYTTAMGQVQSLEALGQQPFTMSNALAQQTSQAGANVGRLGLSGAEFSTRLATSPAATTNPYSTVLGGVGSSNQFGQAIGGLFGSGAPVNALSSSGYGPGNAGFQNMIDDIYGERVIGSLYS